MSPFPAMIPTLRIACCALALVGWTHADVPKKAPKTKYTGLWMNSPFTSKPPPPEDAPEANPLEDYALLGVSPIAGGYRVTVIKKKEPETRIFLSSTDAKPKDGLKVLGVTRKAGDPLGTVVRMSSGLKTGNVGYDEKLLTLAQAPAQKPQGQPGQAAQPGQPTPVPANPAQPGTAPDPRTLLRNRIIQQPPQPGAPGQTTAQPTPPIGTQPAAQPTGGPPRFDRSSFQRPDRRGGR
jgi:hypothetical protein